MRVPFVPVDSHLAKAARDTPGETLLRSGAASAGGLRPYLAIAWVKTDPQVLFETVILPDRLSEYMGLLYEVKQLSRGQGKVVTKFVGGVKAGPIKLTFDLVVEMNEKRPELTFSRVVKGSLQSVDFAHRVDPMDGGALLQSSYDLDLGQVQVLGIHPFRNRIRFNNLAIAGTAQSMVAAFVDLATDGR